MKGYKSVSIDEKILKKIKNIVKNDKYLYRNPSEFINSTLRDKLLEFRKLQLKEKEIELMEKQKNTFNTQ